MELLTHGGEHHEIGDGRWLMMTMAMNPPLRSPEPTPDQPSRERLGLGGGSISQNAVKLSLWFFLRESQYMELELRSVDDQGAHEAGAHPGGGGAPPPSWTGCGPLVLIISPVFFIFFKIYLRGFSGHSENFSFLHIKQHHGSSAKNSVSPG